MTQAPAQILIAPDVPPVLRSALLERYDCVSDAGVATQEISVLVTTATLGADEARMASLPGLRAICSLGVGVDTLDLVAAERRGIMVSNTPDVLNDCVADLAVGMVIDVARGISRSDRHVRRGDWPRQGPGSLGWRVSHGRLGLLGMGRIARTIAQRLSGFNMDIRYHARSAKEDVALGYEPSLVALAQWADFLVVACAGGASTRHLVNSQVLDALGPQGFLINVARGSVVDESALLQALSNKTIAGAALDVFENEPHVPEAFFALDNVVLLPHIGSATAQTRRAMGELLLGNIERFLSSGELLTPCSR